MSKRTFVGICFVPLAVLVAAFFLLPMARLIVTGATGAEGLRAYAAILLDSRYRATLLNTVSLAAATTIATLIIATISGLFLQRHRFPGHALLVAMLTFPLAFPGVVVGFMIILLAGRQGLLGDLTLRLFGTKEVFAYSLQGLFLGYLYFSIPRVILTVMAAVEKLDPSLGGGRPRPWRRSLARRSRRRSSGFDASLHCFRRDRFCHRNGRFRDCLYARHRRRGFADADLHGIHAVCEHCASRGIVGRAGAGDLGHSRTGAQLRRYERRRRGMTMRDRLIFAAQLLFTVVVAAFLIVPAVLSMLAGVTLNYFRGIQSGLTLQWVMQVWQLYADTIFRSFLIAFAALAVNLIVGIPAAYALHLRNDRLSRVIEEVITLPLAIPGLALALALLLAYGGFSDFRRSWLFILAGHAVFTLPFMVRSVMAVFGAIDVKTLDEGAASLGASPWRRFRDVIVPNAAPGILAGSLMVVTLSLGEFNLTWMLHTPLTKTLPVGLADSYASMRLEVASAYTLVFFVMIVPLLVAMQIFTGYRRGPAVLPR